MDIIMHVLGFVKRDFTKNYETLHKVNVTKNET